LNFCKYQGAGNDFVIIDNMDLKVTDISELAVSICDRRFGVGADGFILAEPSSAADVKMDFYNSDGSMAAMCGNGIRCFAKFVINHHITDKNIFSVETGDGIKHIEIIDDTPDITTVKVDMGGFSGMKNVNSCGFDAVSLHLGVPHAVIFADTAGKGMEMLNRLAEEHGREIEYAAEFSPERTNVNFVDIINNTHILCSTWERGAGKTLACGTGACSSAVSAHFEKGLSDRITVTMPGGEVTVTVKEEKIYLEGSAVLTFKGEYR
jgi:diaminopimelate epimerase